MPKANCEKNQRLPCGGRSYRTRWDAVRSEMGQGAKFGFCAFCAILGLIWVMIILFIVLVPDARRAALRELAESSLAAQVGEAIETLLVRVPVTAFLFGAIPGGLIKGLSAAIRWRAGAPSETGSRREPP